MSRILIIAGMHRSGTSLITQWLTKCGLSVGSNLAGPEIGNVEGLFEDIDFQSIHKKMLRSRKLSPIGFEHKPFAPPDQTEKQTLLGLIDRKQQLYPQWGWKDPITCLFLDVYRELIPTAFYLVIVRDFRSTVTSLVLREHKVDMKRFSRKRGLSRLKWKIFRRKVLLHPFDLYAEKFLKVWIHYYERLLDHISTLTRDRYLVVNYRQLLSKDRALFQYLQKAWQFSFDYFPFAEVYKPGLINKPATVERYIRDKSLIMRAEELQERFESMLSFEAPAEETHEQTGQVAR